MNKKLFNKLEKRSLKGDSWFWPISDNGCWDFMQTYPDVPERLSKYVKEKKVVVQAGGNCGFYIKKYAELFERVYTFEPDPLNFLCLNLNCDYENVIKIQSCVGDKPNFCSIGNIASYEGDAGAKHVVGVGIIPTLTIDSLGLDRCDLIQLDTEGYEYFGILGALNTIEKFKPVMSIEWYDPWGQRYGVSLSQIENLLRQFNYKLVDTYCSDRIYICE